MKINDCDCFAPIGNLGPSGVEKQNDPFQVSKLDLTWDHKSTEHKS